MDTCKWYVSPMQTECGDPAVAVITHVAVTNEIRKLNKPTPVCSTHKAQADRAFAAVRLAGKK